MPSNSTLNAGSGGDIIATKQRSHDGDTTQQQAVTISGVTGTEDAYTFEDINGTAANGLEVDVTRVQGTVTVDLGANNDVTLNANSGVDVGDVTINNAAGASAVNIQDGGNSITVDGTVSADLNASTNTIEVVGDAAENAAAAGNPVLTGGRYDATPRTLGDGDVGAIALDADGAVQVSDGGNTLTVDGTVTANLSATDNAVLDSIDSSLQNIDSNLGGTHVDDAAFTVATDDGVPAFAMFDDVTPDSVDEGDAGILRMSANRNLYSTIRDAAGNERGANVDASNRLQVLADLGATDNAVLDNIQTAVETIDNAVHVDDAPFTLGTDSGMMMMGFAGTQLVATNDAAALTCDVDGALHISDGGNSITVDGIVTANLSATDNAVLDNIDTNTTGLNNTVGTDGAAGPSSAVSIGGTESGGNFQELRVDTDGHLQVDVLSGGGSGTEYTEDAAAAANPVGGVNILVRDDTPNTQTDADGDNIAQRGTNYGAAYCQIVDSSGNFIDTFGGSGGTAAADDADFTAGTTQGTPAMGVFESSPTSVTDGDLGTVGITSTRSLKVEETNSGAILADTANMDTNLGTIAGAVTGTEMQVDIVAVTPDLALGSDISNVFGTADLTTSAVLADGVATSQDVLNVRNFNYVYNGTTFDFLREGGEAGSLLVDLGANNDVTVSGTITADAGTNLNTSALLTTTNFTDVLGTTDLTTTAVLADGVATSQDVLNVRNFNYVYNGTTFDFLREGGEAGSLLVDLGANNDVTVSGTVTVTGDSGGSLTVDTAGGALDVSGATVTVDLGANNDVQGAVAHDSPVSTPNPFLLAGEARTSLPTAVANGDVVRLQADDDGRLVTQPMSPRDMINDSGTRVALTSTTRTELVAAGGAGVFNDLVGLVMSNESATEVRVDIFDDATAGQTVFSVDLAADGGGAVIMLPVPWPQGTANQAWDVQLSAAVSTVYVSAICVERQ